MHFCIFIGFLGLFAQTSVMAFMSHFLPEDSAIAHTFFTVGEPGSILFDVWGDLFGAMLLLGLVIAIVRRYVVKSRQLETISRDTVSIVLLTTITVTGFLCEGFRLMDPQYASVASYSFIGSAVASILNAAGVPQMAYTVWVWIHALISLFFLAYIPFSKAWHIFVSPVEIILDASERA
jgi:nitrate reductase gamma subunit